MRYTIVLILHYLLIFTSSKSVNYCGSRMCRNTNTHTFCQYKPGPSSECTGYIPAPLSNDEKARIMARFNRRRNEASYGRLRGFPSAGNMLKLRWVEELAREAQLWADQCRPPATPEEQDVCRDLYSITVGQCVASVVGEAPGLHVESMIDMWYMQSMVYKGNITSYAVIINFTLLSCSSPTNGAYYGDFGQMMWSRAYMVGCGRSKFMIFWQGRIRSVERLVCNIAPRGPVPGRPLWTPALPASACPPRSLPDELLKGLCNFHHDLDESQDVDNSFTLEEHIVINTVMDFERNSSWDVQGNLDKTYLTRLAIATMVNPIITPMYYNSMQKRDIVELVELEELENDITKVMPNNNNRSMINTTISSQMKDKSTKQAESKYAKTLKEIKLVGRPKTYNIEELTEVTSQQSKRNNEYEHTHLPKIEKEPYDEYNFLEVEDNTTLINAITESIISVVNKNQVIEEKTTIIAMENNVITSVLNQEHIRGVSNLTKTLVIHENVNVSNETAFDLSTKNDILEDYLDDPETVQQLQEALDRMEQTMESSTQPNQGKVRRELRNFPPELPQVGDRRLAMSKYYHSPELEAINKTLGRGPVMNMMMKYVPYLKGYERNILSRPSSKSSFIGSGLSFVFTTYLFSIVSIFYCSVNLVI